MDRRRPAIVIDGTSRGDIGVVRSLGLAGIPVHLLTHDRRSPTAASRYVTRVHEFPGEASPVEVKVRRVQEVARSLDFRPLLFATGDSILRFISANREALEEVADHDLPPRDVLDTCLDKDRFAEAAERLDLPVPRTYVPEGEDSLGTRLKDMKGPYFVKPVLREDWARLPPGIVRQEKGMRVETATEMVELYRHLAEHGGDRIVIQEMVVGDDDEHMSVHAYATHGGKMLGAFTAKKFRIWPAYAGVGALVQSHPFDEPIQLAERALEALGYSGFAILQFKRSARTGQFQLLEINCRYSTWTELPTRSGCNFPAAAYATMTGTPVPELRQRNGIAWLDFERDLGAMRSYLREGDWSVSEYLRSLATVRCWAYFAWDDPLPLLAKLRNKILAAR